MTDTITDGAADATTDRRNPYVGPRSFYAGEALYGRGQEIGDLRDLLIAERIVLLYSPSGAGKTSLLEAGLRAELARRDFRVLPTVRVGHEAAGASGANRYLLSTLVSLEEGRPERLRLSDAELAEARLAPYLDGWTDDGDLDPCLFFDQFEELFTLDPTDVDAKAEFLIELGVALRDRGRWALFAMREDFIAQLDPYLEAMPKRFASRYRLDLLGVEAATAAARLPAAEVGVDFTAAAAHRLVDDLRTVRVQRGTMVSEEPGPYVEPVQLQVVCHRLWTSLDDGATVIEPGAVESVGDVDDALADFYLEQVRASSQATGVSEREIRDWVEASLITEQGFRNQVSEGPPHDSTAVLRSLEDGHLIRAERRRGTQWYELAHDRLVPPIRASNAAWREANLSTLQREAQAWDQRSRPAGLLITGEVLAAASDWAERHEAELLPVDRDYLEVCHAEARRADRERAAARRNRRLAVLASIVGIVAVLGLIGALLAYRSARDSERAAKSATAREAAASADRDAATERQLAQATSSQWFSIASSAQGLGGMAEAGDTAISNEVATLYAYEAHASASDEPPPQPIQRGLATTRHHLLHDPIADSTAVAVDRTGRTLVRGTDDGRVELVDIASLRRRPLADLDGGIVAIGTSASDDRIALQTMDKFGATTLSVWVPESRSPIISFDASDIAGGASALAIAGNPGIVAAIGWSASQSEETQLVVWDAATGARMVMPEGDGRQVHQLAVSRDGTRIAASDVQSDLADASPAVHVWERAENEWQDITPPGLPGAELDGGLAFDAGGDLLAFGGDDGHPYVVTLATGDSEPLTLGDEGERTGDVAFLPDGRLRVLTPSGTIMTLGRASGAWAPEGSTAFVPGRVDGALLGGGERVLYGTPPASIYDATTGGLLVGAESATAGVTSAERDLVVRDPDPSQFGAVFESRPAEPGWTERSDLGEVTGAALSTDGATVAAYDNPSLRVQSGSRPVAAVDVACPELGPLLPASEVIQTGFPAVADGADYLGVVRLDALCTWSPAGGAPHYVAAAPLEEMGTVAIDGPGTMAVVGSDVNGQGAIRLYELASGQQLAVTDLPASVTAVAAGLPGFAGSDSFVYAGGDARGNVVLVEAMKGVSESSPGGFQYYPVTSEVQLPVDAPVVALDMVSIDTGSLLAVATSTAVYVYAFEGETQGLVGGYDLLRGEGKVLDLGFRGGDPTRLAVVGSDQSVYEFDPRADPGEVAAEVRAIVAERGLLPDDAVCQQFVHQPCPTGSG